MVYNVEKKYWMRFNDPVEIIIVENINDVIPSLERIERIVEEKKYYAYGFISYESSGAFDSSMVTHQCEIPLLYFGLFKKREIIENIQIENQKSKYQLGNWVCDTSKDEYFSNIEKIKSYIKNGDTYQVNYTLRFKNQFKGNCLNYFFDHLNYNYPGYSGFLENDRFAIASFSPELFFTKKGNIVKCKPMKGTVPRGVTIEDDLRNREWLFKSEKNRAENLMILDMIRNDLGRIADIGSIKVPEIYTIKKYHYVYQMISKAQCKTNKSLSDIFNALFPCASITGAPKIKTMDIINKIEKTPRGVYTGTLGFISPNDYSQFNVAIRTVFVDKKSGSATYGAGGGIVWDSVDSDEYIECQVKTGVLEKKEQEFSLLEALLWDPEDGYFLKDFHLDRLSKSAEYFDFKLNLKLFDSLLVELENELKTINIAHKVRAVVHRNGKIDLSYEDLCVHSPKKNQKIGFSKNSVKIENPFLYHKTTNREVYNQVLKDNPHLDDVILWNDKGEITESTRANIVLKINNEFVTPHVKCGLLGGTFREKLLRDNKIVEQVILKNQLNDDSEIFLINSVRKWMNVKFVKE